MITIENRTAVELPDDLLIALNRSLSSWLCPNTLQSSGVAIYNLVWLDVSHAVGTIGEGAMGVYEWFIWDKGRVRTSQQGYGDTVPALRDVLNQEWPA